MESQADSSPEQHRHTHPHPASDRDHSGDQAVTRIEASPEKYAHIPGWGADMDRRNRPAVPMERTPARLDNVHWHTPENQPQHITVFHSTERPGVTPVFGTSTPPTGVSGSVRALAYRLSENDIRHWLLLFLADRINVVEGIGSDLARGRVPNVFAEMGLHAELRHNREGFMRKVAVGIAVTGIGLLLLRDRREARRARRLEEEYFRQRRARRMRQLERGMREADADVRRTGQPY